MKKTFKNNESYFKFIMKHRGMIEKIKLKWTKNDILCDYELKKEGEKNGKSSTSTPNNDVNSYDNSWNNRNHK